MWQVKSFDSARQIKAFGCSGSSSATSSTSSSKNGPRHKSTNKNMQKQAETINSQHGGCIGCIAWGSDGVLRKHCPGHQLQILSRISRSGLAMCTSPLHFGLASQIAMEIISDQMPGDVTKILLILITIFWFVLICFGNREIFQQWVVDGRFPLGGAQASAERWNGKHPISQNASPTMFVL